MLKKSIFSKAPRLTSANIDGKQTNQNSSVDGYMELAHGPHLLAFKNKCQMQRTAPAPHYSSNDVDMGSLKFRVVPPKDCVPLLHLLRCMCSKVCVCVCMRAYIFVHLQFALSAFTVSASKS